MVLALFPWTSLRFPQISAKTPLHWYSPSSINRKLSWVSCELFQFCPYSFMVFLLFLVFILPFLASQPYGWLSPAYRTCISSGISRYPWANVAEVSHTFPSTFDLSPPQKYSFQVAPSFSLGCSSPFFKTSERLTPIPLFCSSFPSSYGCLFLLYFVSFWGWWRNPDPTTSAFLSINNTNKSHSFIYAPSDHFALSHYPTYQYAPSKLLSIGMIVL